MVKLLSVKEMINYLRNAVVYKSMFQLVLVYIIFGAIWISHIGGK